MRKVTLNTSSWRNAVTTTVAYWGRKRMRMGKVSCRTGYIAPYKDRIGKDFCLISNHLFWDAISVKTLKKNTMCCCYPLLPESQEAGTRLTEPPDLLLALFSVLSWELTLLKGYSTSAEKRCNSMLSGHDGCVCSMHLLHVVSCRSQRTGWGTYSSRRGQMLVFFFVFARET